MPTEPLTSLVDKAGSTRVSVWPSGGYRTAEELAGLGTGFLAGSSDAGRRVGTILTNDYMSVALVLGCIANRIPLVSLPTPARGEDVAAYRDAIVSACTSAEVSSIYLSASFAELLELLELDAHGIAVVALEKHQPPVRRPTGDGFELVQFTSGTTGRQKGVVLSDGSLGANVSSILNWLRPAPGDNVCSWLPLSHDMGLVGMLLSSICAGPAVDEEAQVTLMSPETFLRSPSSWLEAMSATRTTIAAAPDFAVRRCASSRDSVSGGADLSSLRALIVGAEPVQPQSLSEFSETFASNGFDSAAFRPAYGLAEAGLAVTGVDLESHWQTTAVRHEGLEIETVLLGQPLAGYAVDAGTSSEASAVRISGPSLLSSYTESSSPVEDGWFTTADIGCLNSDGQLAVVGRSDDIISVAGRNLHLASAERAVGAMAKIREGRVVACGLPGGGWAIAVETTERDTSLATAIRATCISTVGSRPDEVVFVDSGALPFTSSGKPKRWALVSALEYGHHSIVETH